jgi:outer membrane cobalamin receptor
MPSRLDQLTNIYSHEEELTLDELMVTAERRTESLQTAAVSVSAFTGNKIDRRQIETTLEGHALENIH